MQRPNRGPPCLGETQVTVEIRVKSGSAGYLSEIFGYGVCLPFADRRFFVFPKLGEGGEDGRAEAGCEDQYLHPALFPVRGGELRGQLGWACVRSDPPHRACDLGQSVASVTVNGSVM